MQSFVADKHNFGQSVVRVDRGSDTWYRKPRSTFWERFFFGKDSPLRELFLMNSVGSSRELATHLFNLDVEVTQNWLGFAKEVTGTDRLKTVRDLWYSYGVLIAYSYIFGIRDLHKHNVLITNNGMQAVDAEVVLSKLILPCETALLPYKNVPFDVSAISRLSSTTNLNDSQVREIFDGFLDTFRVAFEKSDDIKGVVHETVPKDVPIRVILRNTKDYLSHLSSQVRISDLLHEEEVQLNRGDIPFFFKFLGERNLFFIASPNSDYQRVISDLGSFQPDVDRHACSIDELLPSQEALDKKMAQGVLYLCRLFEASDTYVIPWNSKSVVFNQNSFKNEYTGLQVALKK